MKKHSSIAALLVPTLAHGQLRQSRSFLLNYKKYSKCDVLHTDLLGERLDSYLYLQVRAKEALDRHGRHRHSRSSGDCARSNS